jgi:lipoate-protein ligase A
VNREPGPTGASELAMRPWDRDDDLLARTRADGRPRVRVVRYDEVAVVIGRGGKQHLELHTESIAADGVPLYRRRGGGCAVVLDPGNVIVSLALPLPGIGHITSAFAAITGWMIDGLGACGFPGIEQRGVSDLAHGDRKIGGSCVYRTRGLLYYSTTLLCDQKMALVGRYLRHPPREPEYRRGRDHDSFMSSLTALFGRDLDESSCASLKSRLDNGLQQLMEIPDK